MGGAVYCPHDILILSNFRLYGVHFCWAQDYYKEGNFEVKKFRYDIVLMALKMLRAMKMY